jgi:hypothetical protein
MSDFKAYAISQIAAIDDDEAIKLVAELKVALLADADADGGLTQSSRERAWRMANDLGKILLKRGQR